MIHIFFRTTANKRDNKDRPDWFSYERCWKNLLGTCMDNPITVIHDGEIEFEWFKEMPPANVDIMQIDSEKSIEPLIKEWEDKGETYVDQDAFGNSIEKRLEKPDREKAAVDEWLASDKGFHIMRDHPAHGTQILGGMWGAKSGSIPEMKSLISEYSKGNFWQVDQNFLREKIYPMVRRNSYVHDEFFEKKPFPTKRKEGVDSNGNPKHFIGEPVDENDERIW